MNATSALGERLSALHALRERLQGRREEIERAALARTWGLGDPAAVGDPHYLAGLRMAVSAAVSYGIEGIDSSPERLPPVPAELHDQARQAARLGVPLDTVLRRYCAGYALLSDFLVAASQEMESGPALQVALRRGSALFDRLIAAVAEEYVCETRARSRTADERRTDQVRRLLAGELLDAPLLAYDLDAWHIGAVLSGPGARSAVKELATSLDRRLLTVRAGSGTLWAWLGGHRVLTAAEVLAQTPEHWPAEVAMALGEAGQGVHGWRLSHQQAKSALPIAVRGTSRVVRHAEVALLAAALADEVLAQSLRATYLEPLEGERDGGRVLRETLSAYIAVELNASAAAAALGISRTTMHHRLRAVENRIGRTIDGCAAEIHATLKLVDLLPDPPAYTCAS